MTITKNKEITLIRDKLNIIKVSKPRDKTEIELSIDKLNQLSREIKHLKKSLRSKKITLTSTLDLGISLNQKEKIRARI